MKVTNLSNATVYLINWPEDSPAPIGNAVSILAGSEETFSGGNLLVFVSPAESVEITVKDVQ